MKKWMTVICAILLFSTAVITVNAEDAGETDGADEPVVLAETSVSAGDFTISGDDLSEDDYSYADGVLTISGSAPITISAPSNDADNPTTDRIVVDSPSGANITLSGVNINTSSKNAPAFEITANRGSVTVILEDNNTLTSGQSNDSIGFAGLQNNSVPVTITGSGHLTATGGTYGGAGIGGCRYEDGKNITIGKSDTTAVEFTGTITAYGSSLNASGAGIGGGSGGNGTNIKISGSGTVIATGGRDGGAGIGGGEWPGNGTNITISMSDGGKVEATGGNQGGAGIGGGRGGNGGATGDGNGIYISGSGTVIAKSTYGAGIGGGKEGDGTNIEISGSVTVTATYIPNDSYFSYGAGIGGGQNGDGTDITISDSAKVTATGGYNGGAGIGGGRGGNGTGITIDENFSGEVTATGGYDGGAGIGGGGGNSNVNGGNGINITISGSGTVAATGNSGGAGIGGGGNNNTYSGNGGNGENINITISGGTVTAKCESSGGTGIGGGKGGYGNVNINSSGGTVDATGGSYGSGGGAGIGSGSDSSEKSNITISNGTVNATGGSGGAGIGSGSGSSGESSITISGGNVTATGGSDSSSDTAPGIGGDNSNVTIDVSIKGGSETSYPWVITNEIKSTNGTDDYRGIIFDKAHTVGVVYGTVTLTGPYTVEGNETLRVHSGATLKTNNNLTLAGTLYLEAGAKLDKYNKLTITGAGQIKHEDPSKDFYVEVSPGKWICDICGKEEPHVWEEEWQDDDTHHWHKCKGSFDCSVNQNAFQCSIEDFSTVTDDSGYGEHEYDFDHPDIVEEDRLYFYCKVCKHEYIINIPIIIYLTKEDGENAPLAGAEFGLYSDEECTEDHRIAVGTTKINADNRAVVSFDIEQLGKTYYIKEIKAPDGYTASEEVFKAIVGANGKVTYGVAGSETTSKTVPVCKNYAVKITYNPANTTKVDEKTGTPYAVSPKTGYTGGFGIAGIAILSGITCAASLVGMIQKRKRKNSGD